MAEINHDTEPPIILLADDNEQTRELFKKFFAKAKERGDLICNLIDASDGDEAIIAMDKIKPHLILCDIGMPEKDGFEVLKHYNKHSKIHNPFCFFCFLSAAPEERARAFKEGAMGFLSKLDINYYIVVLQIKTWLRLSNLERQVAISVE